MKTHYKHLVKEGTNLFVEIPTRLHVIHQISQDLVCSRNAACCDERCSINLA